MKRILFITTVLILLMQLLLIPSAATAGWTPQCITLSTLPANVAWLGNSATLMANITSMGNCDYVDVSFQYGTGPGSYSFTTNQVRYPGTGTVSISVAGLAQCTTYYFRPVGVGHEAPAKLPQTLDFCAGVNLSNVLRQYFVPVEDVHTCTVYGDELSFNTGACPPPNYGAGSSGSVSNSMAGATTTTFTPVNIVVQNATLSTAKAGIGEQIQINATVRNRSNSNGSSKITLYVNGQEETHQGVQVNSGDTTHLTFNVTRNEPGTYQVVVGGYPAGSFTVDYFTNNEILIYVIIGLFTVFIGGVLFILVRRTT
jgi:hypothetical protein